MAKPDLQACPACRRPLRSDGECNYCLLQLGKSDWHPASSEQYLELPPPEQLQRSFPQLEITRLIGRGGMGAIYHARQKSLDRDVALKIIARNVADDPAFEERFTREAKTLAKLAHPNIVTVYDFGSTADGLVYLLMEYVDGVNLREAMDASEIRSDEALQIIREMCAALQFAHDRGVVHRDIKPENVLLNEDGVVKVADFGLAKLISDTPGNLTLTNTRQVMGTLRYMAPEQFENPSSVDHRADVYALGVVFYELLTGQVPVGRFEPPSRINPAVAPRLDAIVMRSLDRRPPSRYQRVSEIATELSSLAGEPAMAFPLPPVISRTESLSVPFSADLMGSLAQAIGNVCLRGNCLEVNYRTRDNVFHILKSSLCSVKIPLEELAKLEWRPGVFCSMITIGPKSMTHTDQLPGADASQARLTIAQADTHFAAKLVYEAAQREPALRNTSSLSFTERIATAAPPELTWSRLILSVLFFVCGLLNIVGMILVLIALSTHTDNPLVVLTIVLTPILTTATVVAQIVGGIYCLSPYTRRMPLAAATVSVLPLATCWPLGLCVGVWAWWVLSSAEVEQVKHQPFYDRHAQALGKQLGRSRGGRLRTTLMFLRESRWSRFLAIANVAGLLSVLLLLIGYQVGCYPTTIRYRVVDDAAWGDELRRVEARLAHVLTFGVHRDGNEFHGGKQLVVRCMKWSVPQVQRALASSGPVQWAWIIEPLTDVQAEGTPIEARVGGSIDSQTVSLGDSVQLADLPATFQMSDLKSVSGTADKLNLSWTVNGRTTIEQAQPTSHVIGLALIIEEQVEGVAPLAAVTNRGVTFTLAQDSKFEAAAIEAAIRGPELRSPLELINRP